GAVAADQGGGVAVADQGVVLDPQGHGTMLTEPSSMRAAPRDGEVPPQRPGGGGDLFRETMSGGCGVQLRFRNSGSTEGNYSGGTGPAGRCVGRCARSTFAETEPKLGQLRESVGRNGCASASRTF